MKTTTAIVATVIALYTPFAHGLKVYTWVDENGLTNYSDRRPMQNVDGTLDRRSPSAAANVVSALPRAPWAGGTTGSRSGADSGEVSEEGVTQTTSSERAGGDESTRSGSSRDSAGRDGAAVAGNGADARGGAATGGAATTSATASTQFHIQSLPAAVSESSRTGAVSSTEVAAASRPSPSPSGRVAADTVGTGSDIAESEVASEVEVIVLADSTDPHGSNLPPPPEQKTLAAFPGAEGFGASSRGGRGGRVFQVSNLNDSGPGTLRECVEARGPRICTFRIAGYIDLESEIVIRHPYLTIAGQTAPGSGVYLRADPEKSEGINGLIEFKRFGRDYDGEVPHDVVIRYVRFRHGRSPTEKGDGTRPKNIEIWSGYNIILDHVSSGWVQDNLITIIAPDNGSPPVHDITIQRSLFAEALEGHSTGMNIQGQKGEAFERIWNISVHHNLFANNEHRNPRITTLGTKAINNVAYNWSNRVGSMTRGSVADWINNYWIGGPMSNLRNRLFHEDRPGSGAPTYPWTPSIYIAGNIAPDHADPTADNWPLITLPYDDFRLLPESFRRNLPLPRAPIPITIHTAAEAYESVLNDVGANARLDCGGVWLANFDSIDHRVITEVRSNSGPSSAVVHQDDVGGWPPVAAGTPCVDSDGDGMPDFWETLNGFNASDPSDGPGDADGDGYTNLEEFLNGSAP